MSTPRTSKGQFVKGSSGNPTGGNKWVRASSGNKYLIEDLLAVEAPFVLKRLIEVIRNSETPPTALVTGAKLWLDHALGKPLQRTTSVRSDDDGELIDLSHLDTDVLRQIADARPQGEKGD